MLRGCKKRSLIILAIVAGAFAALGAPSAFGSTLIAHHTTNEKLLITPDHKALMTFKISGQKRAVLAWGALNARAHPTCGKFQGPPCGPRQVDLKHVRLSPTGHFAQKIFHQHNTCGKYDGPPLQDMVAACKEKNGTYWAVQRWVRLHRPCTRDDRGITELRVSHWRGPLPKLVIYQSWERQKGVYHHMVWGQYTYKGKPIYGLKWNPQGVPLDGYGRVVYLSVFNPRCGKNWRRLEGVLSKWWKGQLCRTTWLNAANRQGERYHALAMGPGVLPDISSNTVDAQNYNQFWDWQAHKMLRALSAKSKFCKPQPMPYLVVNEVLTGATGAPTDQFVELYNSGQTYAHIGGYKVVYRGPTDTSDTVLATIPKGATLGVGRYYLLAGPGYQGAAEPNLRFNELLGPLAGGVGLRDNYGNLLDSVGYGSGVTNNFVEGSAAPTPVIAAVEGRSISRIPNARDTNDNSADFKVSKTTPGAKNSSSSSAAAPKLSASLAAVWRHLSL